jgi:dTDP-3-amino-3,4,6-trideoxy-alpha-D-glucose transaminase
VATHPDADAVLARLAERGIEARSYYRRPIHRQPAMAPYVDSGLHLPVTDELARTHLALPMSPVLTAAQAAEVVAALTDA